MRLLLLFSLCLSLTACDTTLWRYRIPTPSMEPTLEEGEAFWVRLFKPGTQPLRHGEVVVFGIESLPDVRYVKRIVAMGGDRVAFRNDTLFLNGVPQEEPYVNQEHPFVSLRGKATWPARVNFEETVVPEGHVFLMGDNRHDSEDSRHFGAVQYRWVTGKLIE